MDWSDGVEDLDARDGADNCAARDGVGGSTTRDGVDDFGVRDGTDDFGVRGEMDDSGTGEMVSIRSSVVPFMAVAEVDVADVPATLKRAHSDMARPVY